MNVIDIERENLNSLKFNIKFMREEEGIPQKEIAKKLGVSRSTYSLWELEINIIPLPRLIELCKIYHCSIDYILKLNETKRYPHMKEDIDFNLHQKRLKEIRKEHKYTQAKIAKILNTDNGVISRYESGKTLILTRFLIEYTKIFNISADYLLGKINDKIIIKKSIMNKNFNF